MKLALGFCLCLCPDGSLPVSLLRGPGQDSLSPQHQLWPLCLSVAEPLPKLGPGCCASRPDSESSFPVTQARLEGMGLGTRRCAGQECGGAGQAARSSSGYDEGGGKEGGGRDRQPEGGAVAAGRGIGEGPRRGAGRGSHERSRGGDGEESGRQGPRGAGVLTSLSGCSRLPGARRAAVGSGSCRAGPASPQPSPDGAQPRPARRFPRRGPGHSLCKRRPPKGLGSLPNRCAYLAAWQAQPLEGPKKGGTGTGLEAETALESRTKRQRPDGDGDWGRTRERRRVLRGTALHALRCSLPVGLKGEGKE